MAISTVHKKMTCINNIMCHLAFNLPLILYSMLTVNGYCQEYIRDKSMQPRILTHDSLFEALKVSQYCFHF